ncbi:MAG TPA: hypothetical protein VMD27_11530 [Candidatus Aquilonibacter sp.]|nr:hypothetical protein [Candidatus Aquilonibacter sp.]
MRITFRPIRYDTRGFALILTLAFVTVSLIVFGSMMLWVSSNAKVNQRNNQFNMSEYAAEAAVERVLAQMDRDFLYQSLTTSTYYATLLPSQTNWPIGYQYSGTNSSTNISVWIGPNATNTQPLDSQYTGLYGLEQNCTITATATPASASGAGSNWTYQVPATVSEQLQFASIPIFQFAIFYQINLEICPGSPMLISGPVFCNASIWEGSDNTTFSSTVAAVGTNDLTKTDPFATSYAPQSVPAVFSLAGQPTSEADALTLPIAGGATNSASTNVESIINLPPSPYSMNWANAANSPAYSTNGLVYLANAADLYITNTPTGTNFGTLTPKGTNIFVYYQDSLDSPTLALVTPNYYLLKTNAPTGSVTNYVSTNLNAKLDCVTNVQFASYTFLTNVLFYDWREGGSSGKAKPVQAVQIDISKFSIWQTNTATNGGSYINNNYDGWCITHKGHHIDSMFVYNAVPLTTTTLPAVRVVHGQQLPSPGGATTGFTVVTPMPMYVWGNYNVQNGAGNDIGVNATTYTYPAALMADAITILSSNWVDQTTQPSGTPSIPTPTATTINAAMLEGIVPSNPAISGNYSGGVENFLRLLEAWGNPSPALTYNGSIVVMFPSQYATNSWSGNYYGVPKRNWAFDLNFETQSGLPPLTPQTKAVIRGQWTAN